MRDEDCLGENPKGFPTQRAALRKEGQLRLGGLGTITRDTVIFPV